MSRDIDEKVTPFATAAVSTSQSLRLGVFFTYSSGPSTFGSSE